MKEIARRSGYEKKRARKWSDVPFENQKQACPLEPVRFLPGSLAEAVAEGKGHHGSNGTCAGTALTQGFSFESIALRGGGYVIAPCASIGRTQ